MEAGSIRGESTDAIVTDDSPTDEREIQEACQRWVVVFSAAALCIACDLITTEE